VGSHRAGRLGYAVCERQAVGLLCQLPRSHVCGQVALKAETQKKTPERELNRAPAFLHGDHG
jgi:hypothetical protein